MGLTTFDQKQRSLPATRVARSIEWKGRDPGSRRREKYRSTRQPPPAPLRDSDGHGNSRKPRGDKLEPVWDSYHWVWFCCYCGLQGGMTTLVGQCLEQDCQHHRCKYCPAEKVKCSDIGITPRRDLVSNPTIPNLHTLFSKTLLLENSKHDLHIIEPPKPPNSVIDFEAYLQDVETSTVEGNVATKSLERGVGRPLTPNFALESTLSTLSSTLTPESEMTCGPLSYREQDMESETELESDVRESEEDIIDSVDVADYAAFVLNLLDSRLFSVLGHDLELAARLIPQIHAQLQVGLASEGSTQTAAPTHESAGATKENTTAAESSSDPANESSIDDSGQSKRGRERDESEDRRDGGGSKRRSIRSNRNSAQPPSFACHFHKKDPQRYCRDNDLKFRVCMSPSITALRRLKEHFKNAHRTPQCERCYAFFKDLGELTSHRRAGSCSRNPDELKEGIDDSQMEKIEYLLKAKKRRMGGLERGQHDIDIWFAIWEVLFPGLERPVHPWVENAPAQIMAPSEDADTFIALLNRILEPDFEQGRLERNSETQRYLERAIRLAFETQAAVTATVDSLKTSGSEDNKPEEYRIENPSGSSVAAVGPDESAVCFHEDNPQPRAPSTGQQDLSENTNYSQVRVPQTPNTQMRPSLGDPLVNIPSLPITQATQDVNPPHEDTELMAALIYPAKQSIDQNIDPSQDLLEYLDGLDFAGLESFDPMQDDFISYETNEFDFLADQLGLEIPPEIQNIDTTSNDFTNFDFLNSETERPEAMEEQKSKRDRNKGLPKPLVDEEICP